MGSRLKKVKNMSEVQTESRMDKVDVLCNDCTEGQQNHGTEKIADVSGETGTTLIEAEATGQTGPVLELESEAVAVATNPLGLRIDPRFRNVISPLTAGELAALTEDISIHGCCDPLKVLKGEGIILDGHHRFEICEKLGIPYEVVELEFPSHTDAKSWMIKSQRARRNLNESQRAMLAVTLEALYCEQAKEWPGTRTDLGLNLDPKEAGRSAEKAAKDMGISHQTVSYAKKVATKGIPELAKLVESGDVAVSAAARVVSLPEEKQKKVVEEFEIKKGEDKNPKIADIMQDITEQSGQDDPDERLERFRRNQEAQMVLLNDIETTLCPENLVEMLVAAENTTVRLKEIETKSLEPGQSLEDCSIIEIKAFRTFLESLIPANNAIRFKFDRNGVSAVASDPVAGENLTAAAFLSRELFARYKEIGEICLSDSKAFDGWMSVSLGVKLPGKKNMRIVLEPMDPDDSVEVGKLRVTSGTSRFTGRLSNPKLFVDEQRLPQPNSTCKVIVKGKDLLTALKTAENFDEIAKFLVSDQKLKIVTYNEKDGGFVGTPPCTILVDGNADSRFVIRQFYAIKKTIGKCEKVTLYLGMGQTLIMEMEVDRIAIRYYIKEESQSNLKSKRAERHR